MPDWPITVWRRSQPAASAPPEASGNGAAGREPPLALTLRGAKGLRILALNPAACDLGLRAGQPHADAAAMVPHLVSRPADPARDAAALKRLALWAERYSPLVSLEDGAPGDEALLLDMTGGAHLFGGETALLADLGRRLAAAQVPARLALADTPAAAWALARFAPEAAAIAPPGATAQALADLPLEALRLEPNELALARRFGLGRVGDLYGLPRAGLARRFRGAAGLHLVERLDKALGALPDPRLPVRPAPLHRAWRIYAEPLTETEGLTAQLPELAQGLALQLTTAGQGARRLSLTAFRVDGRAVSLTAGLSAPSAAAAHWLRLFKEMGLERLDLGFGADALMLSADRAEPLAARQPDLQGETDGAQAEALSGLIDRLEARLGQGSVRRPQPRASWIPERSEAWRPAAQAAELTFAATPPMPPRPLLLLRAPEPVTALAEAPDGPPIRFTWRRAGRRVVKAEGPERLSPEWWRRQPDARTRDYYRVEDDQGRRYWLFREGLYGREDADAAPTWWMHGLAP